jgi:tellurite resistance protein
MNLACSGALPAAVTSGARATPFRDVSDRCSVTTTTVPFFELDLTHVDPEKLRAAVCAALEQQRADRSAPFTGRTSPAGRLPSIGRLKAGAQETLKQRDQDARQAEYFQSLLELGYLVASADGLALQERVALAALVEEATGSVVARDMMQRHFTDLDGGAEVLGRRERLARVASNFEDRAAREEAMSFAALIAIADGKLADPEARVLLELGEHFSFSEEEVKAVLSQVAVSIKLALEG